MYAIIRDRGKQYRVAPGEDILIDFREDLKKADPVEFDEVLVVGRDDGTEIGTPLLKGARVLAEVEGPKLAQKVKIQKFRRRENYRRKLGHRQRFIQVKIKEIVL